MPLTYHHYDVIYLCSIVISVFLKAVMNKLVHICPSVFKILCKMQLAVMFGKTAIQSQSPHKRPLILRLDVFFVVSLNKLLKQQLSCWFGFIIKFAGKIFQEVIISVFSWNVCTQICYNGWGGVFSMVVYNPYSHRCIIDRLIDSVELWWSVVVKEHTQGAAQTGQATGLDARASRVKWPAQFMSHWYGILFTE